VSDPILASNQMVQILQYTVDSLDSAQQQTANNIANNDTPNYIDQEVSFEQSLQQALESPDGGTATTTLVTSGNPVGTNGNNVDLTQELTDAQQETLQYSAAVSALNYQFNLDSGVLGGNF
jgi:flagellar basal body rod protein FlgB